MYLLGNLHCKKLSKALTFEADSLKMMACERGLLMMEKGERFQVTLSQNVSKKLKDYCEEKGMKRSAVITMALDKFWKEVEADKSQ